MKKLVKSTSEDPLYRDVLFNVETLSAVSCKANPISNKKAGYIGSTLVFDDAAKDYELNIYSINHLPNLIYCYVDGKVAITYGASRREDESLQEILMKNKVNINYLNVKTLSHDGKKPSDDFSQVQTTDCLEAEKYINSFVKLMIQHYSNIFSSLERQTKATVEKEHVFFKPKYVIGVHPAMRSYTRVAERGMINFDFNAIVTRVLDDIFPEKELQE